MPARSMLRCCKKPTSNASRRAQLTAGEIVIPATLAREDSTYPRFEPTVLPEPRSRKLRTNGLVRCCQKPAQCAGEIIIEAKAEDTDPAPELFEEEPAPAQTVTQPMLAASSSDCCCLAGLRALLRTRAGKRTALVEETPRSRSKAACQDSASKPIEAKAVPPCATESPDGGSAARPALGGRWVFARFEGDMEQLLVDVGCSWAIRRLAKGLGYGVGNSFLTILQDGDSIEMVTELPTQAPSKKAFVVGRPDWHETVDTGGSPLLVRASWNGEALVMESKSLCGKELPVVLYRLNPESGELVEEMPISTGGKMVRFFKKQ